MAVLLTCHVLQTVDSDRSILITCHSVEDVVQKSFPCLLDAPLLLTPASPLKAFGGDGEGETFMGLVGTR